MFQSLQGRITPPECRSALLEAGQRSACSSHSLLFVDRVIAVCTYPGHPVSLPGWSSLWVSPWRCSTCRWSGSRWASSGRGCCCLRTSSRASSTPCSSVSGSSSAGSTSWWQHLFSSWFDFSTLICPLVFGKQSNVPLDNKMCRTMAAGTGSRRTGGRSGWCCSAHQSSSYLTWVKGKGTQGVWF